MVGRYEETYRKTLRKFISDSTLPFTGSDNLGRQGALLTNSLPVTSVEMLQDSDPDSPTYGKFYFMLGVDDLF